MDEKIKFYKNILSLRSLLFSDCKNIIDAMDDVKLKEIFVDEEFLNMLLNEIKNSRKTNIITKQVKKSLYEYLYVFRQYNKNKKKSPKITTMINDCVNELNRIDCSNDDIFYENQLHLRKNKQPKLGQKYYIDEQIRTDIDHLIMIEPLVFSKLIDDNLTIKEVEKISCDTSIALSINMFVNEFEDIKENQTFCFNVYRITETINQRLKEYGKKDKVIKTIKQEFEPINKEMNQRVKKYLKMY